MEAAARGTTEKGGKGEGQRFGGERRGAAGNRNREQFELQEQLCVPHSRGAATAELTRRSTTKPSKKKTKTNILKDESRIYQIKETKNLFKDKDIKSLVTFGV